MSKNSWISLVVILAISLVVLTSCGGDGEDQVEVFSWWTGGGEAAGLEAMIEIFQAEYPDIEFINAAVAGGAGTNARAVLATRLQSGEPPDSWQVMLAKN
jgi:glucose/mannose transport system substrate-binding protein